MLSEFYNTLVTINLKWQLLKQQGPGNTAQSMTLHIATSNIILSTIYTQIYTNSTLGAYSEEVLT